MSDEIPKDLVVEILKWLTPTPLLRFRAVSRSWKAIIDSPSFISRNLESTTVAFTTTPNKHHIINVEPMSDPCIGVLSLSNNHVVHVQGSVASKLAGAAVIRMEGPVNGVYYIMVEPRGFVSDVRYILWNPGNRHSLSIPPVPAPTTSAFFLSSGFGYDSSTSDYKIIGIGNYCDQIGGEITEKLSTFHLYSLETNSWSTLDPFRVIHDEYLFELRSKRRVDFLPTLWRYLGTYFNGASHWVMSLPSDYESGFILSFSFATQDFRVYSLPRRSTEYGFPVGDQVLSVRGCLTAVYLSTEEDSSSKLYYVYVMREYGVNESWIRAYSVPWTPPYGIFLGIVDDEFFVREDFVVPIVSSYCLHESDEPAKQWHVYFEVDGGRIRVLPYQGSLVPLNQGEGEGRDRVSYDNCLNNITVHANSCYNLMLFKVFEV